MSEDLKCNMVWASALSIVLLVLIGSIYQYNVQTTLKAMEAGYSQRPVMSSGPLIWSKDPCQPVTIR